MKLRSQSLFLENLRRSWVPELVLHKKKIYFTEKILCDYVPEFRDAETKTIQDFDILTSPWCSSQEDEEFYINTIIQIGQVSYNT